MSSFVTIISSNLFQAHLKLSSRKALLEIVQRNTYKKVISTICFGSHILFNQTHNSNKLKAIAPRHQTIGENCKGMALSTRSKGKLKGGNQTQIVQHNAKKKEFFMDLPQSEKAVLQYAMEEPDIIDFYHTGVPPSQRGKGLAKLLVKEGLTYAKESGFKIRPSCSYVDKYIRENVEGIHGLDVIK